MELRVLARAAALIAVVSVGAAASPTPEPSEQPDTDDAAPAEDATPTAEGVLTDEAEPEVDATPADADSAELTASEWRVVDGFPTSQELILGFAPGGSLSGNTACFDFEGTYSLEEDALTVDASRSGSLDCSTSEFGAADAFLGVLDEVETWSIDDGRLTIGLPDDRYPFDLVLEPVAAG